MRISARTRRRRGRRRGPGAAGGFTLVEVLIASAAAMLIVLSGVAALTAGFRVFSSVSNPAHEPLPSTLSASTVAETPAYSAMDGMCRSCAAPSRSAACAYGRSGGFSRKESSAKESARMWRTVMYVRSMTKPRRKAGTRPNMRSGKASVCIHSSRMRRASQRESVPSSGVDGRRRAEAGGRRNDSSGMAANGAAQSSSLPDERAPKVLIRCGNGNRKETEGAEEKGSVSRASPWYGRRDRAGNCRPWSGAARNG